MAGGNGQGTPVPADLQLEEQVIGGLLLSDLTLIDAALSYGSRLPDLFHRPRNRAVSRAFIGLRASHGNGHEPFSPVTAAVWLDRSGEPAPEHGWLPALFDVQTTYVGIAGGVTTALARLDELATSRQLLAAALEVASAVKEGADPGAQLAALGEVADRRDRSGRSNWNVVDLAHVAAGEIERPAPSWLTRPDGQAYLYPGRSHFITALPKVGKGWLAVRAVYDVIRAGGTAVYIDAEDTPHTLVDRLRGLGTPDHTIADGVMYLQPAGPLGPGERAMLLALASDRLLDLVVFDGVAEVLAASGVDEDRNTEVAKWWAATVRPLERLGCTVLLVDHTRKPEERRGQKRGQKPSADGEDWARGAGHKRAAVTGAHYHLVQRKAATYTQSGELAMYVAADRPGAIPRSATGHTATVHIQVDVASGGTVTGVVLNPPAAEREASDGEASGEVYISQEAAAVMSRVLMDQGVAVGQSGLLGATRTAGKKWSAATLEHALTALVMAGYVEGSKTAGWRGVRLYQRGEPL